MMKPDFDLALQEQLDAISNRDIEAFKAHLTEGDTLYTVVQNGLALTRPEDTVALHDFWFKDKAWSWKGTVAHKVVGEDMALAVIRYSYQHNENTPPFENWRTYVFQIQNGSWRIIHDQNTALDYNAFARVTGLTKS